MQSAVAELDARLAAQRVATTELGLSPDQARDAAVGIDERPALAVAEDVTDEQAFTFGVDQSAQHNLVLFVFITSLTGGAALIESRRLGTARRMLASPASPATILIGEAAARFAIALGQALIVLAGATLFFGARWGDPLAVTVVVLVFCLVGTGAAMLFGSVLSSTEQASAIARRPASGSACSAGRCGRSRSCRRPCRRSAGVRHSWAIEALREVGSRGGTLADVVGPPACSPPSPRRCSPSPHGVSGEPSAEPERAPVAPTGVVTPAPSVCAVRKARRSTGSLRRGYSPPFCT